jgi:hypothetical protein
VNNADIARVMPARLVAAMSELKTDTSVMTPAVQGLFQDDPERFITCSATIAVR